MTDKEMQEQQTALQEGMRIKAIELGYNPDDLEPVYDGVVDINKYLRSSPRLMWVLKEPYDDFDEDGNPYGGGWTILADLPPGESLAAVVRRNPTFRNVAWASFSIKHDGVLYENLPWIQDDPTVADALLEVAYVNVSKMPGRSRTDPTTLLNLYESWKPVLFKQIDLYKPDVMIFCGTITLQCFAKDMGLDLSVPEQSFRHGQSVVDVHHWQGKRIVRRCLHDRSRNIRLRIIVPRAIFLSNREIYESVIFGIVSQVKKRIWIATADSKDVYVETDGRDVNS